ncbi:MAG: hypothetical protein HC913_21320 [Microscillaceae bacterium]|nr:hypothetical protein [Microscillaceae bacterium]
MDDFRHQIHLHEYYTAYFKEQHLREGKVISPNHAEMRQNLMAFMAEYHAFKTEMMAWLKQLAEHTQAP